MNTANTFANKAFQNAKTDRWEADHYVKNAAARAKKTAKKEAARAVRHGEKRHIAEAF